jgi:thioesterase-3
MFNLRALRTAPSRYLHHRRRQQGVRVIHTQEIKIRGYHIDVFGHVNNARYLEFLEEARWDAFEETVDIQALAQRGYAFTVVNININYRSPAVINDTLRIETQMQRLGNHSAVIQQAIKLKGTDTVVAEADVTFVIFDADKKKAAALEGELLTLLKTV